MLQHIEYRIVPTPEGWRIASQVEEDRSLTLHSSYLTQPAAVAQALALASEAARLGDYARVSVDGDGEPLCDFAPRIQA